MKPRFCAGLLAVMVLGGCAVIERNEAAQQERWLTEAGFHILKAESPQQRASLERMTPYRIESRTQNGTMIYRFADPANGRIYVGGPAEYEAYREISVSAKSRRATNLAQMTSTNWRVIGPMVW